MAKTDWGLTDTVKPDDFNDIGREINQLRTDVDHIEVPAASLTEAGIVQLSNATNSTAEDRAATPKAVKSAYDTATAAQNTANAANLAAGAAQTAAANAQSTANAAETPTGAQAKVNAAVGALPSLLTTAKGNAVAAINELFTSASNGKTAVAAAITGKGVPASGSDTFAVLAQKIGQIVTGKRYASGILTSSVSREDFFHYETNNRIESYVLSISGLDFVPAFIFCMRANNSGRPVSTFYTSKSLSTAYPNARLSNNRYIGGQGLVNSVYDVDVMLGPNYILPVTDANAPYSWFAIE